MNECQSLGFARCSWGHFIWMCAFCYRGDRDASLLLVLRRLLGFFCYPFGCFIDLSAWETCRSWCVFLTCIIHVVQPGSVAGYFRLAVNLYVLPSWGTEFFIPLLQNAYRVLVLRITRTGSKQFFVKNGKNALLFCELMLVFRHFVAKQQVH